MSASSSTFSAEHQYFSPSDQLCYVHCSCCDTVLAVSVPGSSLFKTVTVRCGHCSNLLSVNMRGLLIPASSPNQLHNHFTHSFFTAPEHLVEEIRSTPCQTTFIDQPNFYKELTMPIRAGDNNAISKPPVANRPPEKRQRVPSAYNRFIKEEIQRIKAGNPDISHREAFSAAAKNWAHYPHIHFGLMPDQPMKKSNIHQQQEGGDVLMKDEFFTTAAANGSLSPY